jgi:hypothetical protein
MGEDTVAGLVTFFGGMAAVNAMANGATAQATFVAIARGSLVGAAIGVAWTAGQAIGTAIYDNYSQPIGDTVDNLLH